MLVTQLRVQFGQSFILFAPRFDLFLQLLQHVIFSCHLSMDILSSSRQLHFERFDSHIVLLQHELVTLVLTTHEQQVTLNFSCTPVNMVDFL